MLNNASGASCGYDTISRDYRDIISLTYLASVLTGLQVDWNLVTFPFVLEWDSQLGKVIVFVYGPVSITPSLDFLWSALMAGWPCLAKDFCLLLLMEGETEVMMVRTGLEEISMPNYLCVVLSFEVDPSYKELPSLFSIMIAFVRSLPVRILQVDEWRC